MNNEKYVPVCGIYCGDCDFLGKQCQGCGNVDGKPFWTHQIPLGVCPLHDCCCNKKHIEHCGLCEDFPCKIFLELRDPTMNDDEFQGSLAMRQKALKRRTEIGTKKWLEEVSKT